MAQSGSKATYATLERWTEREAREALRAQEASGLTLAVFAAQQGFDADRLYRWRGRLRDRAASRGVAVAKGQGSQAPSFVEVGREHAPLELVLRSGQVLRVPASFDAGTLRRLVEILEVPRARC